MAVNKYIELLKENKKILTAIELLDIKEYKKSRFQNGRYSMFARGLLSSKLMDSLNWHGYHFVQVDPAYTSQICPNCFNLDKESRNGKRFVCTCCGHSDDADHVGSVNIKSRVSDEEISSVCEKNKYNKELRHSAIRAIFAARHAAWREIHPNEILTEKKDIEKAASTAA